MRIDAYSSNDIELCGPGYKMQVGDWIKRPDPCSACEANSAWEVMAINSFIVIAGCLPESELPQIYTKNNYDPFCISYVLYGKIEKKTYVLKKSPDYNYIGFIDDINNAMPFKPRIYSE